MDKPDKGIADLRTLIESMEPILHDGDFVFTTLKSATTIPRECTLLEFKEPEGITLILAKEDADKFELPYTSLFAWITLSVHSALNAVGFTAAFSNALSRHNISCNVVAGYYHDHIFVSKNDKNRAVTVLKELSNDKSLF